MVQTIIKGSGMDIENIAGDIWLELFAKGKEASWLYIRNRCWDALRKERKIKFVPDEELMNIEDTSVILEEPMTEVVNLLIEQACLSIEERDLLYRFFYNDEKVNRKDLQLLIQKLRNDARLLIMSLNNKENNL